MFSDPLRGSHRFDQTTEMTGRSYSIDWGDTPSSVAPYVPSPLHVVRRMLELAGACGDDVIYDLGCGDGRILLTAVEEFDVKRAVGYDLNPVLCDSLRRKIESKGLGGRVEVVNGNFFLADLSPASLITLYLTTSGNSKLRPKFEAELGSGARVVSHDFPIHGWTTVKANSPDHYAFGSHRIYLYRVPEAYGTRRPILRAPEEQSQWRRIRAIFHMLDGRR
mgnify:CR=1 FL=1